MRHFMIAFAALYSVVSGCAQAPTPQGPVTDLGPSAFQAEIKKPGVQLIDVRTPQEFAEGHIAGSRNMNWMAADHESKLMLLDPAKPVLLYCQAGGRSSEAKRFLEGKGFQVKQLATGFAAWQKAGLPAER